MNRTDVLDRTALHFAVQNDAKDAARLLIAHGADVHAKDWQGRTPLDLAESEDSLAEMMREDISLRHAGRVKAVRVAQSGKRGDAG